MTMLSIRTTTEKPITFTLRGTKLSFNLPINKITGEVEGKTQKVTFFGEHDDKTIGSVFGVVGVINGKCVQIGIHGLDHAALELLITEWLANKRQVNAEKAAAKSAEMEITLPGLAALTAAYAARGISWTAYNAAMKQGRKTSVFNTDEKGKKEAEELVTTLTALHPKAQAYIVYSKADPASSMGFASNKAAKALLNGQSLSEAKEIANDWDKWSN
jgi:hypothetical protein